jgi:hypothetical protein
MVGHFPMIYPIWLPLRVCAGKQVARLMANAPDGGGITALKCQILRESRRESCALHAIPVPAPVSAHIAGTAGIRQAG